MRGLIGELVERALAAARAAGEFPPGLQVPCVVAPPEDPAFGDLACSSPIAVARELGVPAPAVAARVLARIEAPPGWFSAVEVGGPGFLNFRFALPFLFEAARRVTEGGPFSGAGGVRSLAEPAGLRAVVAEGTAPLARRRAAVVARALKALGADARVALVSDLHQLDRARTVRPGPVWAFRAGRRTDWPEVLPDGAAGRRLAVALLRGPIERPLAIDWEWLVRDTFESPPFALLHARDRLASLEVAGPRVALLPEHLGHLTPSDRPLLHAVASWPDVWSDARATFAPHLVVSFAGTVAAAVHADYNRGPVMRNEPERMRVRRGLLWAARSVLDDALACVGVSAAGG